MKHTLKLTIAFCIGFAIGFTSGLTIAAILIKNQPQTNQVKKVLT